MHFDIIVIGGGPGGYVTAIRAAQLGKNVALIERERVGGTCLNHGCIPTKTLYRSAEVMNIIAEAEKYGVAAAQPTISVEGVRARKEQVVTQLTTGVASLLKGNGVTVITGEASIGKDKTVTAAGEKYTADHIIIATGSKTARLPVPGIDLPGVMGSTEALALEELPQSLVIIGGGVIGVEMAGIYKAFGAEVTIVEFLPAVLSTLDGELSKFAAKRLAAQGIKVLTGAKVTSIEGEKGNMVVTAETKDGTVAISCTHVLNGAGRTPCIDGLGIEEAGIEMDGRKIKVDENYRTNIPGIYAIGDVIGGAMLAHVASDEGRACVERICGMNTYVDYDIIPACVFAFPELASVGKTEEQLKAEDVKYNVARFAFSGNGKALSLGETDGLVKIIASEDLRSILGVHIAGPHASDLIHEAVIAMKSMLTVEEAAHTMHAHPSLAEAFMECMQRLLGEAIHVPPAKRRGK